MINELQLIENIDILFDRKVVLYGAGRYGIRAHENLKRAGIPVDFFCDKSSDKIGKSIDGIVIISPEQLKKLDEQEEIVIIITTGEKPYIMQIFDNIETLQIKTDKVLTMLGLEILFAQNAYSPRISKEYRDFLLQTNKLQKDLVLYQQKASEVKFFLEEGFPIKDILVYSPPKVGSTSATVSLRANGLDGFHAHNYTAVYGRSHEISSLLINMVKTIKNPKIITLVREPLSTGLSIVFEIIDARSAYEVMSIGDSFVDACIGRMKEDTFVFSHGDAKYGFEFDWFDCELKSVFGIDVFAHPFDREKGYSIIRQNNVEVLLMKLEKLNSLESVIGEFVGVPDFKLVSANENNHKSYKYLYKNVRDAIKIPKEIVSLYYDNNPRMNHFYTDAEKAAFLKKWENNIAQ